MELDYDVVGVSSGVSGVVALFRPSVNVSAKGEVPMTLQVFRIRLPCSGLVSAQIPLALRLNVTAPPGTKYNDTILVFKRNKICLKGDRVRKNHGDGVSAEVANNNHSITAGKFHCGKCNPSAPLLTLIRIRLPVQETTTKSNPPNKIESRQESVYLMKEKRGRISPSKIKRIDCVESRVVGVGSSGSGVAREQGVGEIRVQAPPRNDSVRLEPGPLLNGAGALYVAATCACALILVVGSVASALYIRNSKARIQESQNVISELTYNELEALLRQEINETTPYDWKEFCKHVETLEHEYWTKDGIIEDATKDLELEIQSNRQSVQYQSISQAVSNTESSVHITQSGQTVSIINQYTSFVDNQSRGLTICYKIKHLAIQIPVSRFELSRFGWERGVKGSSMDGADDKAEGASGRAVASGYSVVCPFRKTLPCCSYSAADTGGLARSSVLVRVDPRPGSANSGSYATIADLEPLYARPCGSRASYYASSHVTHLSQSTDPCEKARALAVSRSALYCRNLVQEGTFGRVYKGSLELAGREQEVIIKTVTEVASAYQASLLVVEGSQLAGLVHANIASLAAACLDSSCPLLAYTSTPGELNLKLYLTDGNHHPVTRDLVHVGAQVARAGAFLHGRGLLHRDIAARNCLIEPSSLRVRLADTALARDLFPQDYHCLGDNENRPIRWMALETLQHNQYSTATDVWSFGVFLWELATMGQQPYVEVDPFEMMACLRDGYRLVQPRPCPDELFAVMAVCWLGLSRDRPTMPQLLAYLQDFHDALGGFI
ncbi:Tyrosine-protein kinase RYK [Eufriesea mexicana]|nr:Tyrosine-protein kinase RYK [Eufriesea mexicana]